MANSQAANLGVTPFMLRINEEPTLAPAHS